MTMRRIRMPLIVVTCLVLGSILTVAHGSAQTVAAGATSDHFVFGLPSAIHANQMVPVTVTAVGGDGKVDTGFAEAGTLAIGYRIALTNCTFLQGKCSAKINSGDPSTNLKLELGGADFSATSPAFNVVGPFARLLVVAPKQVPLAQTFNVTVLAVDALGSTIYDYPSVGSHILTWAMQGQAISPGHPNNLQNGVSVTPTKVTKETTGAGYWIDVANPSNRKYENGVSNKIQVIGPPTQLQIDTIADTTAGTPFTVTVTATDAAGNVAVFYSSQTGTRTWFDATGSLNPTSPAAFVRGVSTTRATVATKSTADKIHFAVAVPRNGGFINPTRPADSNTFAVK